MRNTDTEQVCKDAIKVVERYLNSDVVVHYADIFAELSKAQEAVDRAWDVIHRSRKSLRLPPLGKLHHCMCCAAWHACLAAKNNNCALAKVCLDEFWELVK